MDALGSILMAESLADEIEDREQAWEDIASSYPCVACGIMPVQGGACGDECHECEWTAEDRAALARVETQRAPR